MPTANETYQDAQIGHADGLEDAKATTVLALLALYNRSDDGLRNVLYEHLGDIQERGYDLSRTTQRRLNRMGRAVETQRGEVFSRLETQAGKDLRDYADYEVEFQRQAIRQAVPFRVDLSTPERAALASLVDGLAIRGKSFSESFGDMKGQDINRIRTQVGIGLSDGNNTDQIVRRVIGTRRNRYRDGILNITRNHIATEVRTATSAVITTTKEAFFNENSSVSRMMYSAILDGRTTLRCMTLDGRIYPVGVGPRPPQHYNCRSMMVAVIDPQATIGNRQSVTTGTGRQQQRIDFRGLARESAGASVWRQMGTRARQRAVQRARSRWANEQIGNVPQTLSYREWFGTQNAAFQREKLGASRYALYREGNLKLDKMVSRQGRPFTLEELKVRERDAWAQAFADDE